MNDLNNSTKHEDYKNTDGLSNKDLFSGLVIASIIVIGLIVLVFSFAM